MCDVSYFERKFEGRPFILFPFLHIIYKFFDDFLKCVSVLHVEEIFRITSANFTPICRAKSTFFKSEEKILPFSMPLCRSLKMYNIGMPAE